MLLSFTVMSWNWELENETWVLRPASRPPHIRDWGLATRSLSGAAVSSGPNTVRLEQVHGTTVSEASAPGILPQSDGVLLRRPGLRVQVRTADCLPVFVTSPVAVAVLHAGWRGLCEGVLEAGVAALASRDLEAWIGPAIGVCCFEVGDEVAARFPQATWSRPGARPHVDLPGEAM